MTSGVVLTAAHVVDDHEAIWVRFPADPGRKTPARLLWRTGDLAALHVDLGDEIRPTLYGRVERRGGEVACQAIGFPWFKMRERRRDSVHLIGSIRPLSNLYSGLLHVAVDNPPAELAVTPWKSMSGSALFVGNRLVGVITEAPTREGAGHLTAQRVDGVLNPEQRGKIGLHRATSVNPPPGRDLGAYAAQVRDLAPAGGLRDRDRELGELRAWSTGDEPYVRWHGDPWSGKTAVASAFVLDPPPGVRVAAFFVINRLGRQDAFLQVMGEQLAAIAEEPGSPGALHQVLESAAERCRENGERLLLVVDGLDEDPDLALLLPRNVPADAGVLVTSRPNPSLPLELPADHPLRRCPVRTLTPTPHVAHLELQATNELKQWLRTNRNDALLGFLAAARGGLTPEDLAELTDLPWYDVEALLESRVFTKIIDFAADTETWVFAHETLLRTAERVLAGHLDGYRARIHDWADRYRARGWPEDTPRYLLGSYERLLTGARLVQHALDPARHSRMSRLTGGQASALREIAAAQEVVRDRAEPDLRALVRLAVARDRVGSAGAPPPAELLVLLTRLGHDARARSLARSIPEPPARDAALAAVVRVLADKGELDRAEALARTIRRPQRQGWALAAIVRETAVRGDASAAEALAHDIAEPDRQAWALAAIAKAHRPASSRLLDRAEEVTQSVVDLRRLAWALAALVEAAVSCGDLERAESLADRIPFADHRVWALSAIVKQVVDRDPETARAVLRRAEATAEVIIGDGGQSWALAALAEAMVRCGDLARAEEMARGLPTRYERCSVLTALAGSLAHGGEPATAVDLASSVPSPFQRALALAAVAEGIAGQGDPEWAVDLAERAEALARTLTARSRIGRTLAAVARAFAVCGDPRAEETARSIESSHHRVQALIAVGATALDRGDAERAAALAEEAEAQADAAAPAAQRTRALVALTQAVDGPAPAETLALLIPEPTVRARVLTDLVKQLARQDPRKAEDLARTELPGTEERERALVAVVESLAGRGDFDRAERLALSLSGRDSRAQALAALVGKLPDLDRAMALANKIPHADRRAQVWVGLIETVAARQSLKRARTLLGGIPSTDQRAQALLALAKVAADQGRPGLARDLAGEAERPVRRIPAGDRQTKLLLALVKLHIRIGHLDRAERLLGDIPSARDRASALGDLAAAMALRGRVGRAVRLVAEINATDQKAHAYVTLVKELAGGGELEEAAAIARRHIPTADHLARALTALVRADSDGKRVVPAVIELAQHRLADRVTHPEQQLQAFAELVKAIADSQGFAAAAPLADKIADMAPAVEDPEHRARILVALSKGVDPGRSRRLLAHVLAGPAWTAALGALREAEPEAFTAAVAELTP